MFRLGLRMAMAKAGSGDQNSNYSNGNLGEKSQQWISKSIRRCMEKNVPSQKNATKNICYMWTSFCIHLLFKVLLKVNHYDSAVDGEEIRLTTWEVKQPCK